MQRNPNVYFRPLLEENNSEQAKSAHSKNVNTHVEVCIPVNYTKVSGDDSNAARLKKKGILFLNKIEPQSPFKVNIGDILTALNNLSASSTMQVGIDKQEAENIVNQHSHFFPTLIVKVSISILRLQEKATEKDMSDALNAKHDDAYFWLHQNTHFTPQNIISISPMYHYRNTLRFTREFRGYIDELHHYWPKDYVYYPTAPQLETNVTPQAPSQSYWSTFSNWWGSYTNRQPIPEDNSEPQYLQKPSSPKF